MQRNNNVKTKEQTNTTKRGISRNDAASSTLQSNFNATRGRTLSRSTTSLRGLSNEPLVRNKPNPKVLLRGDVSARVGWRQLSTNNGMRQERDGNPANIKQTQETRGSHTEISIEQKRLYDKVKAFKGNKKSEPTYTPDKSKSLEERIKAFKQHTNEKVKKGKSKEVER